MFSCRKLMLETLTEEQPVDEKTRSTPGTVSNVMDAAC